MPVSPIRPCLEFADVWVNLTEYSTNRLAKFHMECIREITDLSSYTNLLNGKPFHIYKRRCVTRLKLIFYPEIGTLSGRIPLRKAAQIPHSVRSPQSN